MCIELEEKTFQKLSCHSSPSLYSRSCGGKLSPGTSPTMRPQQEPCAAGAPAPTPGFQGWEKDGYSDKAIQDDFRESPKFGNDSSKARLTFR